MTAIAATPPVPTPTPTSTWDGLTRDAPTSRPEPERSTLNLRHAASFLAAVEEASLAAAASRLSLGQSTLSGHVKALEAELRQPLLERAAGRLVVTPAGWHAYGRLRPLLAGAAYVLRRVRHGSLGPSRFITLGLPAGFPGTPVDAACSALIHALATEAPDLCVLPGPGDAAPAPGGITLTYAPAGAAPGAIPDRWLLLQPRPAQGSTTLPATWHALHGRDLLVPRLSPGLDGLLRDAARRAGANPVSVPLEPATLLATAHRHPGFLALLPRGLVNPGAAAALDRRLMPPGPHDPALHLAAPGLPWLAPRLADRLRQTLDPATPPTPHPPLPEMLSLKHSRAILALYEERHVGRAARRLCVVQPALTMQLHGIEAGLGCRLFERTGRGLVPTPAATRLHAHLRSLLGDIEAAVATLRRPPAQAPPALTVGLIPSLDDESITTTGFVDALQRWQAAHPGLSVQVVEAFSDELLQWLRTRRIDLAVVDRMPAEQLLQAEPIARDPMAAVTGGERATLPPGPVALRDLAGLRLVLPSGRHGLRTLLSRHLAEHGIALEPSVEVDSLAAALRLVRGGGYATVLPLGSIRAGAARRGLFLHEITSPRLMREICLARSRAVPSRQPLLALMGELRAAFAAQPDAARLNTG